MRLTYLETTSTISVLFLISLIILFVQKIIVKTYRVYLDKENKKLIVTIKAEGINTIYKEGTATLTERNIHVYVAKIKGAWKGMVLGHNSALE